MSTLEQVLAWHAKRGSLSEYGPLLKFAAALDSAREAMETKIALEQAEQEARRERELVRSWPLASAPASPDDVCVYSFVGGLPRFDSFTQGDFTYEFTSPAGQQLAFLPASHVRLIPPATPGWTATPAREMFARVDHLGEVLIRMLQSIPLCLALYRRAIASSGRGAVAAAQALRARLGELGRDPDQFATPMASFARSWAAQDAAAERISNLLFTARDGETVERIPGDLLETQMRLSGAQVRASNSPDKINARMGKFHERDQLLEEIARDVRELKQNATTVTEIPQ